MRVALYHNLPSGGAKRTVFEAAKRLVARHQLDIYTLGCAEQDFGDLRAWVKAHHVFPFQPLPLLKSPFGRLNQVQRRLDLSRLSRVARRVSAEIDDSGYDVALVHPCQFEQSPSVLRFLMKTPSVYYCHEPRRSLYESMPSRPYDNTESVRRRILDRLDPLPAMYQRRLRQLDWVNTRSAGAVLVNSRFTAGSVADAYGVDAAVSYHGVDVEQFRPRPIEKRHIVLSVGSLTPLKGFDFVIGAMARYQSTSRPVLLIASNFENTQEREYLERLAGRLDVEMILLGKVTEEELARLYNEARVVVYAPVREPFGLVPLEAMASATPIVAVADGGVPESVVNGETGVLTSRDQESFAAAIRSVVDDRALAQRLGENGRDHVLKHWTWDHALGSLEAHLRDSVGRPIREERRSSAVHH
jgi:glycosyltransferase involved in cell wall biosynthesis